MLLPLFQNHPDGVITVSFKEPEQADACIEAMNNRWFAKRQISAEAWDGKTKFEIQESEAERDARLKKWDQFLEDGKGKKPEGAGQSPGGAAMTEGSGAAGGVCETKTEVASPSVCQGEGQRTQGEGVGTEGVGDKTSGAQGDS